MSDFLNTLRVEWLKAKILQNVLDFACRYCCMHSCF